jgi:chromosomal replication initiator protein
VSLTEQMNALSTEEEPTLAPAPRRLLIAEVKQVVSKRLGVPIEIMTGPSRLQDYAIARQLCWYILRSYDPPVSLPRLGREFGGRDHTTVFTGVRSIAARLKKDPELRAQLEIIQRQLAELTAKHEAALQETQTNDD